MLEVERTHGDPPWAASKEWLVDGDNEAVARRLVSFASPTIAGSLEYWASLMILGPLGGCRPHCIEAL